ncbi:MAG: YeeE/YedE family protein [Proteobacteria bacterium]|nr:YeeE/YedE family protein [Pseudomonadota bacterium]MDA1058697.1 YeeE/YedE family protein [Pseudomonadota bacterium]
MARNLVALAAGLIFGLGLAISEMVSPLKVKAFLDVAGDWDPSLILVMGSAVVVSFVAFRLILRRPQPVLDLKFDIPTRRDIDGRLVGGAVVFGVGWGLVGLCPGPALSGLVYGNVESFVFVGAMLVGLAIGPRLVTLVGAPPVASATPG